MRSGTTGGDISENDRDERGDDARGVCGDCLGWRKSPSFNLTFGFPPGNWHRHFCSSGC